MNIRTKVPTSTEQVTEAVATAAPLQPLVVHQPEQKAYPAKIAKAILKITRELAPVKKAGVNDFHKYQYPKWEDVLEELGPKITDAGLIIQQGEVAHGGFAGDLIEISYAFTIINEDGDVWPDQPVLTAICKVRDSKGILDDKAASKCHTQAQKYFSMQLFKIRVRDMAEDDHDYDPHKHKLPPKRRMVPTSTGKVAPHRMATKEKETAKSWVERFFDCYAKAESVDECNQWSTENDDILDRLQEKAADTYNLLVTAMDEKVATFEKKVAVPAEKKADPISSGPSGGFPGDKPIKADDDGIPGFLRRQQQPRKPTLKDLGEDERDWIMGLGGAFSGCEDIDSLVDEHHRLMKPYQEKVTAEAWEVASDLYDEHVDRINNGAG